MALSRKKVKEINFVSVAADVLREQFTSTHGGVSECFVDDQPETWSDHEKEAWEMAFEVEERLKREILKVFGEERV